ncbi:hypothetical protein HHI36_008493, partial [Cryptolaemus montrouzieri]
TFAQYDFTDWSAIDIIQVMGQALQIRDGDVTDEDIGLYLYTRDNPDHPTFLEHHRKHNVKRRKGTKVVIHGYLENYRATYMNRIREEYLKLGDFNVIQVDWKRVAKSYYMSAAKNCYLIGGIIGSALVGMKIPASDIHLIGFSLGSHIAAFTSKKIKRLTTKQIYRISALDPAGPYYRMPSIEEDDRLNPGDASIVDVIHSDGGFLGYILPIGTFDIYANRGIRRQPGCQDSEPSLDRRQFLENVLCSHSRAHDFYIQSIVMSNLTCRVCENFDAMDSESCSDDNTITIVNQKVTKDMRGICALTTSDSEPYF